MIITLKQNAAAEEVSRLRGELEAQGFVIHPVEGTRYNILGLIGDTASLDARQIESLDFTYEEWLMAAEYIMSEGNEQIVLCERGIRTFETKTRNTLDVTAIPMMHELSHLPIIMDPSHAAGMSRMVRPLSLASVGGGADGLMIEVHNDPAKALCDGPQALRPDQFTSLMKEINALRQALVECTK
ncbi:MAG: hypothetical protein KH306_09090 [Veillonella sp.]|nr:hypothetical protein [Veillonella sp.]